MNEMYSDISKIKRMFNKWRSNKSHKREPIPEDLWRAAAGLCSVHPMVAVCQELGLDRKKLRDRVDSNILSRRTPCSKKSGFVTVALTQQSCTDSFPGAVASDMVACEWIRPFDGARLRMSLGRHEVSQVMSAFLAGGGGVQ